MVHLFQTHTLPPTHTEHHTRRTIDRPIQQRRQYIPRGRVLGSWIATPNANAHRRHAHIVHYGIDVGQIINVMKNNKMSAQTKNKWKTIELDNKLIISDDIIMTRKDIILAR